MYFTHFERHVCSLAVLYLPIPQSVSLRHALRQIGCNMLLKLNTTVEKEVEKCCFLPLHLALNSSELKQQEKLKCPYPQAVEWATKEQHVHLCRPLFIYIVYLFYILVLKVPYNVKHTYSYVRWLLFVF